VPKKKRKEILYQVISASNVYAVTDVVKEWLKAGWEPKGGIIFGLDVGGKPQYHQAIVCKRKVQKLEDV
jgi:hypothetical protein